MITWYINRLKAMSFPEICFRIKQWAESKYERWFLVGKSSKFRVIPPDNGKLRLSFEIPSEMTFPGRIQVFGKTFDYYDNDIDWHKDYHSGNRFPERYYRSIKITGNQDLAIKNVWEINRLQFLIFIALSYRKTGSEIYLRKFSDIVGSWVQSNPYLTGVNWYSNIEVNIRLIVWFYSWLILDVNGLLKENREFNKFVNATWLPVIYQHCIYSYRHPSCFSSSNNHLIAEYAGLFVASSLWEFKESKKWNRYAKKGLETEILRQHSKNGINREEAAGYIQFVTDFFLISYITGEKTGNPFSDGYRNMLKNIFYYICEFLDISGNTPRYGDEDDGKCIVFDPDEKHNNFRSLLTSGAILFNDPFLKSMGADFDMKNRILFGGDGEKVFKDIRSFPKEQKSVFYTYEGHFIIREQRGEREIYLHYDAAPLGFLSIAAHGHADALSFVLHVDGQPVIIDPGTYTYHSAPEWRKYFKGTLAHNTVRINRMDQAKDAGPTLWLDHYNPEVLGYSVNEKKEMVVARHDGYSSLGIIHSREVEYDREKQVITIKDALDSSRPGIEYLIEQPFHLHPLIKIKKTAVNEYYLANSAGRDVIVEIDNKLNPEIIEGQTKPEILGWYSPSFMIRESSPTIYSRYKISESVEFRTVIRIV